MRVRLDESKATRHGANTTGGSAVGTKGRLVGLACADGVGGVGRWARQDMGQDHHHGVSSRPLRIRRAVISDPPPRCSCRPLNRDEAATAVGISRKHPLLVTVPIGAWIASLRR